MKRRLIKGWRKFSSEAHSAREQKPVYNFTELALALKAWK